jgi:hypothetical protein
MMNAYEVIEQHLQRRARNKRHRPFLPDFSTFQFLRSRKRSIYQLHFITFYDTLKEQQFYMRLLLVYSSFKQCWYVKSGAGGPQPYKIASDGPSAFYHPVTLGRILLGGMVATNGLPIISLRLKGQDGLIIDEDHIEDGLVLFISETPVEPSERNITLAPSVSFASLDCFSLHVEFLSNRGEVLGVQPVFV